MNYYAEWWENARKQTGILTKPTYLKQLEKELAQLKANPNYQHLASELTQWKAKYEKVRKELKDSDEITDKLAEENQAKDQTISNSQQQIQELENKYLRIKGLIKKSLAEQKQDYEKQLNNATHNQVSILKTSLFKETENKELKQETAKLKEELALLNSSETDQQRELEALGKLIIKLEEQTQETKKELEFANSKVKQLSPLFNQVLTVIKKNVILRGKKDLKEAIANIQELMEWEKSPLVTEINTPTEPIKTAEQLALNTDLEAKIKELEETIKDLKKVKEPVKTETKLTEPSASDKKKLKKWRNISLDFPIELINQWESKGFSYERTADWINIGFTVKDADYAWWLEKGVGYDPLKYLNETSSEEQQDLKKQFEEYKQSK